MVNKYCRTQRAFVSYSWSDKPLVRRIARRLGHRGVVIWIDEQEMRLSDHISPRLVEEIQTSSHMLVLVTKFAVDSKWVQQEINEARKGEVSIIPIFAERNIRHPDLNDIIGIDIVDTLWFEDRMDDLARVLLGGRQIGRRDPVLIDEHLDLIGNEMPRLRGLLEYLRKGFDITSAQMEAVTLDESFDESFRHPAETALIALYERPYCDNHFIIANITGYLYRRFSIGYSILGKYMKMTPSDYDNQDRVLRIVVNDDINFKDFRGIFRLFEMTEQPHDGAFAEFVKRNFQDFQNDDIAQAVRFVVTPPRNSTEYAMEAVYELFARMPESECLLSIWYSWIDKGQFHIRPRETNYGDIDHLMFFLNKAARDNCIQFISIKNRFRRRFRIMARSRERELISLAILFLLKAYCNRYVGRKGLVSELSDALSSNEGEYFQTLGISNHVTDLCSVASMDGDLRPVADKLRPLLNDEMLLSQGWVHQIGCEAENAMAERGTTEHWK